MTVAGHRRRRTIEFLGAASRGVQGRGWAGRRTAGVTKRIATRAARRGVYRYTDEWGHVVTADLSDYMERAGFFGAHSSVLLRNLRHVLRPGDWVIDVGANVGLVTSPLCAQVGPSGRVWAIEPLPGNVAKLEALKSVNRLGQLTIHPLALAAESGTGRLRLPITGGSGWGSFVATWETSGEVEVQTCRLDELVARTGEPGVVRLVKVDAEGFEPRILEGAEQTLANMRPLVVCEFNDILLRQAGSSSATLLESFTDLGYRPAFPLERARSSLDHKVVDLLLAHHSDTTVPEALRS